MIRIGLDVMGGDFAPDATLQGAISAAQTLQGKGKVVLYGPLADMVNRLGSQAALFDLVDAPEVVGMAEHPTKALQHKPNASIFAGFHHLKAGSLDAFASAGNTGAMLVACFYLLKTIEGVTRPTIATQLPRPDGGSNVLLDVGVNPDAKPEMLVQFGILGSLFSQHVLGTAQPTVGLVNLGAEEGKGNLLAQAAYGKLKEEPRIQFVGNVEGRDLYGNKADVMVCDGFTGNVLLKQAEAMFDLWHARGIRDPFLDRFDFEHYGGTPVLGIEKTVIIGHGISGPRAIANMILEGYRVAQAGLPEKIKTAFQS